MKKILTLLALVIVINASSQSYSMVYTTYCQMDSITKIISKDVSSNSIITVNYNNNTIKIEDVTISLLIHIIYNTGVQDDMFYECITKDGIVWKVSIMSNSTHYLCVLSTNNFTRIYKKKH